MNLIALLEEFVWHCCQGFSNHNATMRLIFLSGNFQAISHFRANNLFLSVFRFHHHQLSSLTMAGTIKLKSFDKQIFEVELSAARLSPKLMELVNSKGTVDEIALEEENLTGDILNRILTWCTRHQNDTEEQLAVSDSDEDEYEQWTMHKNRRSLFLKKHHKPLPPISKWDRQFLAAESNSTLYSMIIGARFLKIKKLRSLTCSVSSSHFDKLVEPKS